MGDLWRRLIALFQRRAIDEDLRRELQFHLEMKQAETGDAATAKRAIGSSLIWRERGRDIWGWTWLDEILGDVRFAVRGVARNPGFAIAAILTLALGIGANCLVFSIVDATVLRPFPVRDPERLVIVWSGLRDSPRMLTKYKTYAHFRAANNVFEEMGTYLSGVVDVGQTPYPERVNAERVTASYFRALGVSAEVGRLLLPEDEDPKNPRVMLLGDGYWRSHFGGDRQVIGRTLSVRLNGNEGLYTVVGILPPEAQAELSRPRDIWVPLLPDREVEQRGLIPVARLKPGVSIQAAQSAVAALAAGLGEKAGNETLSASLEFWRENLVGYGRSFLLTLAGAVGFVLLIACVNVAGLMLARGAERARELSIRSAIGAGRWRLFRQLLIESGVYGLLGGVVGAGFAYASVGAARALIPVQVLRRDSVAVDGRALVFTLGISLLASIIFGVLPAWRASGTDIRVSLFGLRSGGRERTRLRSALIAGEIALALVLAAGAGLMIRSFIRLAWKDVGFERDGLLTMQTGMPLNLYRTPSAAADERQNSERLKSLPGVRDVGISDFRPLGNASAGVSFRKDERDTTHPAIWAAVSPDYFAAMGIPLRRGRLFEQRDDSSAEPVAIISEQLARLNWRDEDPLGKSIRIPMGQGKPDEVRQIVGIVGDTVGMILEDNRPSLGGLYIPHLQGQRASVLNIMVRVEPGVSTAALIPALRTELAAVDPRLSVEGVTTMRSVISAQLARPRFLTVMLGAFGGFALVLVITGVVGVVTYLVRARTYEFGVRMALGATPRDIVRMILSYGGWLAGIGLSAGLAGAWMLTRSLASFLYEIQPHDAATLVFVPVLVLAAVLGACYMPARRAMEIDPAQSLRAE